jgi:periplasmic protein TonB
MVAVRPAKSRRLRVPRGAVQAPGSPFAAVIKLGRFDNPEHVVIAIVGAILAHGAIGLVVGLTHAVVEHDEPRRKVEVVAALEKPPTPPPAPEPPKPEPSKPVEPPTKAPRNEPPPAPAEAAKVIAQADDAAGPADMTSFDLVVGQGKSYAGGITSSKGTSTVAVAENAHIGGKPAADLSRAASPASEDWNCPWPEEEQTTDIGEAKVAIRVHVDRDGDPESIEIVNAPPGGFAEAARQCARMETFQPALDASGERVASVTPPFIVHFYR